MDKNPKAGQQSFWEPAPSDTPPPEAPERPAGIVAAEQRLSRSEATLAEAKARWDESSGPDAPAQENAYNVARSEHESALAVYRRMVVP